MSTNLMHTSSEVRPYSTLKMSTNPRARVSVVDVRGSGRLGILSSIEWSQTCIKYQGWSKSPSPQTRVFSQTLRTSRGLWIWRLTFDRSWGSVSATALGSGPKNASYSSASSKTLVVWKIPRMFFHDQASFPRKLDFSSCTSKLFGIHEVSVLEDHVSASFLLWIPKSLDGNTASLGRSCSLQSAELCSL